MTTEPLPETMREAYGPAMEMTDQKEADVYFERLVQRCMATGVDRQEAESIQRQNLGYYAGYYDLETRKRVERLFRCAHPIFGAASIGTPTPEEAFDAGLEKGTGTDTQSEIAKIKRQIYVLENTWPKWLSEAELTENGPDRLRATWQYLPQHVIEEIVRKARDVAHDEIRLLNTEIHELQG